MHQGPTYRVYSPNDLQSIAPAVWLRSAPAPQKNGLFGFGSVLLLLIVLVGGASFAAQRFVDGKLSSQSLHAGAGVVEAPPAALPPPPAPLSVTPAPPALAEVASAAPPPPTPPKARRKLRHHRSKELKPTPTLDPLPANPYDE